MKTVMAAFALSLALAGPTLAAPVLEDSHTGQQLDQLFQDLKTATTIGQSAQAQQKILAIWLESGDPTIDRQMALAMQAMHNHFYDTALKYFDNIIINRPDYVEAWNQRATLYYMVGNYQELLNDIAKALVLEPRHFGAIAGKGMVFLKLGQQDKALAAFKEALAVDPQLNSVRSQVEMIEAQMNRDKV